MESTTSILMKLIDKGIIPKSADPITQFTLFNCLMTVKGYLIDTTNFKEERK